MYTYAYRNLPFYRLHCFQLHILFAKNCFTIYSIEAIALVVASEEKYARSMRIPFNQALWVPVIGKEMCK